MTLSLTAERLRQLVRYDPATGEFWQLHASHCRRAGSLIPYKRKNGASGARNKRGHLVYPMMGIDGKCHPRHRLAWLYVHGKWPDGVLDHINQDPSDCRLANLREATEAQNQANRGKRAHNKSGRKGVVWCKTANLWRAQMNVNRKHICLGRYVCKEQAAAAYANAAKELYGEFAYTD